MNGWYLATFTESAIVFTKELTEYEITEKETIMLECETSKHTDVKWYKNGEELLSGLHYKINGEENKCTITVNNATVNDTADYSCKIVKNEVTTQGKLLVKGTCKLTASCYIIQRISLI